MKMLAFEPSKRITASEILYHPWIKKNTRHGSLKNVKLVKPIVNKDLLKKLKEHKEFSQLKKFALNHFVKSMNDKQVLDLKRQF